MAIAHRKLPVLSGQDIKRFWSKVDKSPGQGPKGDCWEWKAGKESFGYGRFWLKGPNNNTPAHRIAWFLAKEFDPGDFLVLHRCDNPPCCNSEHLFIGTTIDNVADRVKKGRTARGERHMSRTKPWTVGRGDTHSSRTRIECRPRGELHFYAKLTNEIVRAIRNDPRSQRAIGLDYGIAHITVGRIKRRKAWAHVT